MILKEDMFADKKDFKLICEETNIFTGSERKQVVEILFCMILFIVKTDGCSLRRIRPRTYKLDVMMKNHSHRRLLNLLR